MTWTIIFLFYIIAEMIGTLPPYPDFFRWDGVSQTFLPWLVWKHSSLHLTLLYSWYSRCHQHVQILVEKGSHEPFIQSGLELQFDVRFLVDPAFLKILLVF
jgi:hypothetical protein